MPENKIPDKLNKQVTLFTEKLRKIFSADLVSIILYGSAASGEFVDRHSNLNFLILLKKFNPAAMKEAGKIAGKFNAFEPLFLTAEQINNSTDIFPIEFLDMQENYAVVYGQDVLKNISVDTKNLRFQCEHELRVKLILLRQTYFTSNRNKRLLLYTLIRVFTSTLHILRNILRLKGTIPPYRKELIINAVGELLDIDLSAWQKMLAVKNKKEHLNQAEIESLYIKFMTELEKTVEFVDKL